MSIAVEICGYTITSDSNSFITNRKRVVQTGKNAGTEYLEPLGYFNRLDQAIESLIGQRIRDSNSKTIREVLDLIKKTAKEIAEQTGGY